jgi:outer membrane receptor protein involved in Fe transport
MSTGDIVVTATRRDESSRKVPISIVAVSQAALDTKGIHDIGDLTKSIPGITFTQGWGRQTNIAIRGIYSGTGAATTGIYIDDIPIQVRPLGASSTFTTAYPALFDLERVEVLKGPQGTLFGAGSEGGTIRFITPSPSLTQYSGYSRAELGFTENGAPSFELGSALGGPLIDDKVGFRISGYYRQDGGWVDRDPQPSGPSRSNVNRADTASVHAALTWQVTDNLKITPSVYWQRQHDRDATAYWANLSDPSKEKFVSGQQLAQPETDVYGIYANKIEYDFGFATLISNTSWMNRRDSSTQDYTNFLGELLGVDYMAGADLGQQWPVADDNRVHSFTQEVRLQSDSAPNARLRWTVGAFYNNLRESAEETVFDPTLDLLTLAEFGKTVEQVLGSPLIDGNLSYHGFATSRDRQIAGFGQVDFKILHNLTATAGVRVAHTMFNSSEVADGPLNGGPSTSVSKASQTPVTPKFSLAYQATPDWMVYASASKGFREGGGNNKIAATDLCKAGLAALGLDAAPTSYKSDSTWSYEAGVKGQSKDHSLQISADAFWVNWNGIQNGVNLDCGQGFTANLGKARSRGFELDVSVRPTRGLTFSLVGAYTDAEYTDSLSSNGTTFITKAGQHLPVAPWSLQLSGDYELKLDNDYSAYVHADYDYFSKYTFSLPGVSGYDPSYFESFDQDLVNARIGVRKSKIDASIFVQNLLNSHDILNIHHDLTSSALFRNTTYRPRTVGVSVGFHY